MSLTESHRINGYVPRVSAYTFRHDTAGYLASYCITDGDNWDGLVYAIPTNKKRRV
ncbi:MAG: hypothetical protein IJU16_02280 [Clostridia bacterium]|nr:hypothetical protein [Clostridia bacterium]